MLFWMIVKVAFKSLMANKLRSVLAMLGIIIGVAAVIAMLAIGTGAKQQVLDRISAMGTNLLYVHPAPRGTAGVISGTSSISPMTMPARFSRRLTTFTAWPRSSAGITRSNS